jgi:hypothetical protein
MEKIGYKYKTNKVTHHGYERFYDYFLYSLKNKFFTLLEIGVFEGRSIKVWNEFFPNAKVYGMDYDIEYNHPKGKVFKGDQSKKKDLKNIINDIGLCSLIIDDGSHVPKHQLLSFNYLFKDGLDFGGIYIIEDIETSYWKKSELYGYKINAGFDSEDNIVNIFKDIIPIVNREFLTEENLEKIKSFKKIDLENLKYISFIMFGQNCIIIKKMTKNEYKRFGERKYRFISKI